MNLFISHGSADRESAGDLRDRLVAKTPSHRIDLSSDHATGPAGGTAWEAWIRRTVRSADLVILLVSKHSHSPWCSAELGMAQLLRTPVLPLYLTAAEDLNPVVGHLQAVPVNQPIEALNDLIEHLSGVAGPTVAPADPPPSSTAAPFPGLRPLKTDESHLLFGRDLDLRALVATVEGLEGRDAPLVIVSGPSGSGKSSLVRAGLLPRLRRQGWFVEGPLQPRQLAADAPDLTADQRLSTPDVEHAHHDRWLVAVDQAEELLLLDDEAARRQTAWITACLKRGVVVVLVSRSEFRDELGLDFPRAVDHYVPFLGLAELEHIIRGPARLARLDISESLIDRLVRETGRGDALPLLAFTLRLLYDDRDRVTENMRAETLDRLGGVAGVLAGQAQRALDAASGGDPATVGAVLATLSALASPTQVPPTRSPIRLGLLRPQQREWLNHFAEAGLVAYRTSYRLEDTIGAHRPTGADLADVTHEALFGWQPLAATIDLERQRNADRQHIVEGANRWEATGGTDDTLLISGDRLRLAREEDLGADDEAVSRFLTASVRHDRDRRLRRILSVAAALLAAVATVAAVLAVQARREANRNEVVAESIRLAALANEAVDSRRDLALLTAVAAYRTDANGVTEGALHNALASPSGPIRYFADDGARWSTMRLLDDATAAVVGVEGGPAVVDLTTRTVAEIPVEGVLVEGVHETGDPAVMAFYGARPPDLWVVGLVKPSSGRVVMIDHTVQIRALAASSGHVAFGDALGGVFLSALGDQGGMPSLGPAEMVDTHVDDLVRSVALSPDGAWLASASTSGVRLVPLGPGEVGAPQELLAVAPGFPASERVTFRRDGPAELLAAGGDPLIRRWRLDADQTPGASELPALTGQRGTVLALAFHPTEPLLITGGLGGELQRWDLATGAVLGEPLAGHSDDVRELTLGPTGQLVSTDGGRAVLWDLASSRTLPRPDVVPQGWDELSLATVVLNANPLTAVTAAGEVVRVDGVTVPWSMPEGTRRAWQAGEYMVAAVGNTTQIDRPPIDLIRFGPTGTEELARAVDAVDVSSCLAVVAEGAMLRFIDAGGCGQPPETVALVVPDTADDEFPVARLALSPGEDRVLVVYDGAVEVIPVAGGQAAVSVDHNRSQVATGAAWLDDDRVVVGHDRGVAPSIIDLERREAVHDVGGHDDAVWWFAVDRGRNRLLSAGQDGRVSHTDLDSLTAVGAPLVGATRTIENDPASAVYGLHLVDDSTIVVTVQGGRLRSWELDPDTLVTVACERAGRDMVAAERRQLRLDQATPICPR